MPFGSAAFNDDNANVDNTENGIVNPDNNVNNDNGGVRVVISSKQLKVKYITLCY